MSLILCIQNTLCSIPNNAKLLYTYLLLLYSTLKIPWVLYQTVTIPFTGNAQFSNVQMLKNCSNLKL